MPSTTATTTAAPQPDHVGRFRITRLLGTGSMGAVYLAEDPVIHRKVAIKTLNLSLPRQDARLFEETFLNEARAAGRLNHPHIVTVYDAGRINGQSYIAMEYLKGTELKDLIAQGEKFSIKQAVEIFVRVADALQYAHENGVVHRDVKPANIFMTGKTNPKVLDFGIAQAMTTVSGSFVGNAFEQNIVGTPNYMSPELIQGRPLDGRADIFSLGVVMYEVLTHEVPFKGRTFEELTRNIVSGHPIPPQDIAPEVPIEISRIVAKALAKEPADRYPSARELANDLRKWMAGQRVRRIMSASNNRASNTQPTPAPLMAERRLPPAGMIAAGVVTIACAFAVGAWWTAHHHVAGDHDTSTASVEPAVSTPPTSTIVVVPPETATPPTPPAIEPERIASPAKGSNAVTSEGQTGDAAPVKPAPPPRDTRKPSASVKPVAQAPTVATPAPTAPATGTLAIAVSPWGEVFVNGVSQGLTPPLSSLTLPVGTHRIEIRNGDSPIYITNVEVKPDTTTRLRYKF
ncbi:MAG TPA: serine/threonine-protein kinase [Burkholderiaceae bacterium]|nr:serine/threonine-protein kinase [Burkholderiaceae bacterium]